VKGERFIQYAVALAVVALWGALQIVDAQLETYSAPQGATVICFTAVGFLFGFDKVAALISAWTGRRNGNGNTPPPSTPAKPDPEDKPGE
jgi:hypothetical protein